MVAEPHNRRSESVESYRQEYRARHVGPRYRGWLHFAFTMTLGGVAIGLSIAWLYEVRPVEWLAVPLTFFYANLVEYFGHRYPMHRRMRGLGLVFVRHAGQHHRYFTDESMAFGDSRDFKAVLFPPVLIVFYLGGFMLPTGLLVWWILSANVALLVVATGTAYFLNYELLHFAYHCRPDSSIGRLRVVRRLRRLHVAHHDPAAMTRYNFNITYPIGDWLFGTLKPRRADAVPASTDTRHA